MNQLAKLAVDTAMREGASFADARVERISVEDLLVRNGELALSNAREEFGLGISAHVAGAVGFAALPLTGSDDDQRAIAAATRAVASARELAKAMQSPLEYAREPGHRGEFRTPLSIDPFNVPLRERIELLRAAEQSLTGRPEVVVREAALSLRREERWHVSSDGLDVHQVLTRTGAGLAATAIDAGQCERRSYPASFGGDFAGRGYEHVLEMELASHGERVRDEAIALCRAPACPAGQRDLILMGNQLMLQIHESVGHPTELDRALGAERDLAGGSFAQPAMLRDLQYGSELVDLVADSTAVGGLDTRGWDDEGVASGRWPIVERGRFSGFHTSRAWAARIGEAASRGAARAESWFHPAIVRITNLSLMPGTWKLEALIADTEDAVLCDTVKTWSIDQQRVNFQFTTELGWEIKHGVRTRLLRSPTYQGRTVDFWNSCDAVCDASHWRLWGVPNCGKGNPMQIAEMSHGAAPARFRKVNFVA
ncbi:MAG TPA: TldD/PmbA family protein [Planctomycetota bacterium]|nr:TldD/PmbA family protein [Planctomycetota bacterium]